jgi:hypothetical protein
MFLLYHSDRCNTSETVFHWCYVNDLRTTHAVVCWITTADAAIGGGRCCHTRRPLLPSATVDATRATANATTRESSLATTTVLGSSMRGGGAACFKEGRGCYEPKPP